MTHTYALLELSPPCYEEISEKLRAAGYDHAFDTRVDVIDMHGIGVARDPSCDHITLYGVKYALGLFRTLGIGPIGNVFRILSRTDGTVVLQSLHANVTESGWLIENGSAEPDTRYRTMNEYGLCDWTADRDSALRFARRADAEAFSRQDEDAWHVREHTWTQQSLGDLAMYLTISKSGTKADVVEQVQAETTSVPLPNVETVIRKAIADHLKEFAEDNVPVSVSCSISLSYAAKLDTDGKEVPAASASQVAST